VTWEAAIFWVAVLSVIATLVYGETRGRRQRRIQAIWQKSEEERLRWAWEEFARRHNLVISFEWAIIEYRVPNRGGQYVNAAIVFRITNNGNSAVHNVHCEIHLDEKRLETDDTHRKNRDFYASYMAPKTARDFSKKGGIRIHGPTKAHYRCVCDEAGEIEGVIEFEVPKKIA
jgi:hypothetical protein